LKTEFWLPKTEFWNLKTEFWRLKREFLKFDDPCTVVKAIKHYTLSFTY
jgi:hypothetical protein